MVGFGQMTASIYSAIGFCHIRVRQVRFISLFGGWWEDNAYIAYPLYY